MLKNPKELGHLLADIDHSFEKEIKYTGCEDIFHYTSPEAFLSIVGEDKIELRFTRNDCVNDKSEGINIISSYQKVCNDLLEQKEIDEEFIKNIYELKIQDKHLFLDSIQDDGTLIMSNKTYAVFLCCFSLNEDSLPMWNYYVKNNRYQGYCLGFRQNMIEDYNRGMLLYPSYHIDTKKVIYSESTKDAIFIKLIKDCYYYLKNGGEIENVIGIIQYLLTNAQFVFKSECFSHEQEVRFILHIPMDNEQDDKEKKFSVNYTTKHGYVTPYVTVPFEKHYLEKIVIAPLSEKELSINTVNALLKQRGYDRIPIVSSNIPIRF